MCAISVGAHSYFLHWNFFLHKVKGTWTQFCHLQGNTHFASLSPAGLERLCSDIQDPEGKSHLDISGQKTCSG